jgi:phage N-6-adenine-methyltransferase
MADQLALFTTPQTSITSDDWFTPKWVFDALGVTFDLDVACPPAGPPFVPCRRYYTQADDGLASPWEGLVWMNPPYSKPAPWVDKFLRHGNGIALLPAAKSRWFDSLWSSDCSLVTLPNKFKFHTPNGDQGHFMPSQIWAAGDQAKNILHNSNLGKVR